MIEKQRIAILLPDLGGGGAERVALTLSRGFLERGYLVDLVLMKKQGELLEQVPTPVRIIDLAAKRLRHTLAPLVHYLRLSRPDAMQVSMWPLTVIGILAARLARTGTRVVTSDHSTLSHQYAASPHTLQFLRWSTAAFYPRAEAVVAVSEGVAQDLATLSGINRDRITVIPNPVPVPIANAAADRAVEPAWQGATNRILAVGSFKPAKNFALLLEALARLEPTLDWRAAIVGEGALRSQLEEQARALGISNRIAMPGFVIDPSPWFRTATLFVLSSNYEGLPTVLIEALQAGLTIVATDCESGTRDVLGDGNGTLVPVGDSDALAIAIAKSLATPADPDEQRRAGEKWSGADAAERYVEAMALSK